MRKPGVHPSPLRRGPPTAARSAGVAGGPHGSAGAALVSVTVALFLTAAGCGATPTETLATPVAVNGAPAAAAQAPPATGPSTAGAEDALGLLARLVVIPEADPGGYDRSRFGYPEGGTDSSGCSTRARVLIRDSLDPAKVDQPGCKVVAGRWVDPYTGATYTSPAQVSIDHVVALKEAWRSGVATWPAARLVQFGNDVTDRQALAVVEGSGNEQKGDKDPSRWRPADPSRWRDYASGWVAVKAAWNLTIDPAEKVALQAMLSGSPLPAGTTPTTTGAASSQAGTSGIMPSGAAPSPSTPPTNRPTTPSTTPSTIRAPAPTAPPPSGAYFANCAALRAAGLAPLLAGQSGYRAALDRDSDGVACET